MYKQITAAVVAGALLPLACAAQEAPSGHAGHSGHAVQGMHGAHGAHSAHGSHGAHAGHSSTVAPAALPPPSGSVAIDFAAMPKNLRLEYSDAQGGWVEIFRGKQGPHYVMERQRADGSLHYTNYHNLEGHVVERHYNTGVVRKYVPHHCERVLGECSFQYQDSDGDGGALQVLTVAYEGGYATAFWEFDFAKTYLKFVPGQYQIAQSGVTHRGVDYQLVDMSVVTD